MSVAGRLAIVTGASSGIGAATARALGAAGADVVLVARRDDCLQDQAEAVRSSGARAWAVRGDVSRREDVERLFATVEQEGDPTVLVCCAATLTRASLAETPDRLWEETLATNLTGTFLCCRRALAPMRRAGGGNIVAIASLSGVYGTEKFPGLGAYNVSKYGVVGLIESLAVEERDHGISAVCISPGAVDTDMLRAAGVGLRAGLTPDDVARLVVAMLDPAMAAASGANVLVSSNR